MATIADLFGQTMLDPPNTLRNLFGAPNQFVVGDAPAGMLSPGNIDLFARPVVHNPDGSVSTVRSMSFGTDGGEVLVPTVSNDGRILTNRQAMDQYGRTGESLGRFFTPEDADAYAQKLHLDQAQRYGGRR